MTQEFTVTATREPFYEIQKFLGHDLLKASRFFARIIGTPAAAEFTDADLRNIPLICDSIEFPGQQLTLNEYRIPGRLKSKTPHTREYSNEVVMSFYYPTSVPLYVLFSNWITNISPTSTNNMYYKDIVAESIDIFQFSDIASLAETLPGLKEQRLTPYMKVKLQEAYPINLASLPCNWSDDGFHKMSVTFYYNEIKVLM